MFDKVQQGKQLLKMRQQAKELQKKLAQLQHSEEKAEWKVVVDGTQSIILIEKDGEEMKELTDLLNKAMKEVQKKSAKKMMEEGGGLGGLLGGM